MGTGLELPSPPLRWGTDAAFGMRQVIASLEAGDSPPPDGGLTIISESERPGVFSFSQHHVVAADVDPAWIRGQLPPGDLSRPLSHEFLAALGEKLGGRRTDGVDIMMYGRRLTEPLPNMPPLREVGLDHPSIEAATLRRQDVRAWATRGGVLTIGRGVGGRWELGVYVDPDQRHNGMGLALLQAGQYLVDGENLWAQISVGNALLIRNAGRYGWVICGAEVLFI
jgi:hypothetical protein